MPAFENSGSGRVATSNKSPHPRANRSRTLRTESSRNTRRRAAVHKSGSSKPRNYNTNEKDKAAPVSIRPKSLPLSAQRIPTPVSLGDDFTPTNLSRLVENNEDSEKDSRAKRLQSLTAETEYCTPDSQIEAVNVLEESDDWNNVPANHPDKAVIKNQLRQRFFDLHFGSTAHAPPLFVYETLDITNPKKTSLTASMDALCVAQLATTFQDENLAAMSRVLYGHAISRLNEKISQLHGQTELLDEVVGAISALIPCAWFACVGTAKSEWMRHTQGLNKVIETYGKEALSPAVSKRFYDHWERRAFANSMLLMKAVPPRILQSRNNDCFFKSCAIDVPGLLERADNLIRRPKKRKDVVEVLDTLTALGQCVSEIKRWQLVWAYKMPQACRVVKVKTFKSFLSLCKEHVKVFPNVYTFTNAGLERELRLSNLCLLKLLQAIIDIHITYKDICVEDALRRQLDVVRTDTKTAADSLCKQIPWEAQEQHMAFAATYTLMPLYHTSEFYRRNGYKNEFEWCQEVERSLSAKYGISIDFSVGRTDWISSGGKE